MTVPGSASPNPSLVFELVNSFQRTAALRAAVELEVFAALGEGNHSLSDLARRCGAPERGIRILCDYLTIMGLLVKEDGSYHHTPTSSAFLDPNSPACVASIVKFLANPDFVEPYNHLAQVVRQGFTVLPGQGTVEPENPIWVEFAHNMAPMMAALTRPLGEAVLDGDRRPMRLLDVAAGHGLFGIEIARQNPEAQVVALDWAPVLEVARANAEKAGVLSRYSLKPGSAFEVDFEGPYDIILLTNFLHHFDAEMCTRLLQKCHSELAPGGRVAALEFVPNADRITPPAAAAFALIMLATTVAGDAYTFEEYEAMFSNAGFGGIDVCDIPESPHRIIRASRVS